MVSWWWFSQGITLQQVSLINFTASLLGAGGIQAFKTMRTLRALRPLRAMSRMQGMRVSALEIGLTHENWWPLVVGISMFVRELTH